MSIVLIIVGLLLIIIAGYVLLTSYTHKPQTASERIKTLQDEKYSTEMGRPAAGRESKAALARATLQAALNVEAEQLGVIEDRKSQAQVVDAERQTQLIDFENRQKLLLIAGSKNLDVGTYLELERKAEMDRLELQKQWQELQDALKAGFIYELRAHQHLNLVTEYIGGLYTRAEQLKEAGKDREYNLIEEHIAFMEGDFRGRQRLLLSSQQEDLQGSDENPYE